MVEEAGTVKCKTTKEIKAMARPEFEANPEKFYPTKVFADMGYSRAQCGICNNYYWRHTEKKVTCGDSNCDGKYSFIGPGNGLSKNNKKYTYAECWQGFRDSFCSEKVPCTAIQRYPVVARWRNDVDYVAAGIFCFQPYCVTGELDPPANPLVCPQFCVRFNDLDNIGVTGRHYSGFIMMGNQVFNYKDDFKYFKDECLQYHHRWLTETLGIHPDEITYIEDVWAGGGNLGPSIEYFVRGLEVGNMVFMQYKTFHDGSREDLDVQIIDTGTGLERIAWLMNGTATSYMDTFKHAYDFIQTKVNVNAHGDIWEKFGPYSCTLNIDEVEEIEKTWQELSDKIEVPVAEIKKAIQEVKDLYIILDHTRTILITISDGSLPSNVGGGGNVRNILRRCFMIMRKNGWWDTLGMDGFLEVFQRHKLDLEGVFGPMAPHMSFDEIIKMEHTRWMTTDDKQTIDLKKLITKRKNKLTMDDWITAMQSWGIPADKISELSGVAIPGDLYYEISVRQERVAKAPEQILYNTSDIQETVNMYFEDGRLSKFEGKCLKVFVNKLDKNKRNLLILDQSAFYPTSGGQLHDTGFFNIGTLGRHEVIDCIKVGKCVLHVLDKELPEEGIEGLTVQGEVNMDRRAQLQAHHTGTHLVFASCRKVLGPHIWQAGAKKTTEKAHLDITHFQGLTKQQEMDIENQANRLINESHEISKSFMDKAEAEKEYGYTLYQGGVVPGNSLRVVDIAGVDTEACCGTHADNTSEVGWIRILKSSRISDGIVRLEYVAQERAIEVLNHEANILNTLQDKWSVGQKDLVETGERFFKEYKHFAAVCDKQEKQILNLQMKLLVNDSDAACRIIRSEQDAPTLYVGQLPAFAEQLKNAKKNVVFVNQSWCAGLLGDTASCNFEQLSAKCGEHATASKVRIQMKQAKFDHKIKGQKPVVTKDIFLFMITNENLNVDKLLEDLTALGYKEQE